MKTLKKVVFIGILLFGCWFQAQAQTPPVKWGYGTDGNGNGYAESVSESYITYIKYDPIVCEGSTMTMNIFMGGGQLFTYEWYEVGKTAPVSYEYYHIIQNCSYANDNGKRFYCKVKDMESGKVMTSTDTVTVRVEKSPRLPLLPTRDTTLCYGETLKLSVTANDNYVYQWSGGLIQGETNEPVAIAAPDVTSTYTVTIMNGSCTYKVQRIVNVSKPEVVLPMDKIYAEGNGTLTLTPKKSAGSSLTWTVGTNQYNGNSLTHSFGQITTVKVEAKEGRCLVYDSCIVVPDKAFLRFGNQDNQNDGFAETKQKMSQAEISWSKQVCEGETAYFMLSMPVKSTYKYIWKRKDKPDDILGTEEMLKLADCHQSDVADYYCIVKDLDTKDTLVSPEVSLEVLPVPTAEIMSPRGTKEICQGESVTLRGNDVQSGETYNWMGYDFVKDRTTQDVEVRPTADTTLYVLIVNNGVCRMMDSVRIVVRKVQVNIPDVAYISRGEQAEFTLPAEAGVVYNWTTSTGDVKNNSNTFSFAPDVRTVVKVKRTEGSGCWAEDSCIVYVKEFGVGLDPNKQQNDGFTETDLPFTIASSEVSPIVCEKAMANMNVEVGGYGVYRFAWKKINGPNDTVVVSDQQHFVMQDVPLEAAGFYFCEVMDVKTKQTLRTIIYEMKVLEYPIAEVSQPGERAEICLGETLTLVAYTGNSNVTYLWEGSNITGSAESSLTTAKPEESGTYSLTVNNGYCKSTAYVDVIVKKTLFDLEEVRYVTAGEEVTFAPTLPAGARVNWKYTGGSADGAVFKRAFEQSDIVVATVTSEGCSSVDSVRIYTKAGRTYMGGDGDGFIELEMPFTAISIDGSSIVCEHTNAEFSVRVVGSGLYSYKWYKKSTGQVVSTDRILTIQDCRLAQTGEIYYCVVADQLKGQSVTSEEIQLKVMKVPEVVINLPIRGTQICYGQSIRIDARGTETSKQSPSDEFKYYWDGENIQTTERSYIVDVRPTQTQVYTLKVAYKECVAFDTIKIKVGHPIVELPAYKYVNEGETVALTATVKNVSTGAKINWWNNGNYYPNQNPFQLTVKETTVIRAEVEEKGCIGKDSTFIYPKCVATFRGGEDDGFMESCDVPVINKGAEQVLGCGGSDSVVLKVDYSGNGVKARWQFYNQATDQFEELAQASNLSGVGSPTLTIKPVLNENLGLYRCRLENDCAPVYSDVYTVTKDEAPLLDGVSYDTVEYCEGVKDVMISTTIKNAETGINYRWYKQNPKTGVKEQLLPEATYNQPGMLIKQVGVSSDALYIVEAENACGVTADSIRMMVTGLLHIDSYTGDNGEYVVCNGSEVTLKMVVGGGGAGRSYRLSKIEKNGSKKVISESGISDYTFTNITKADSGRYVWKVISICKDSVESNEFLLNVENPPVFDYQTKDTAACIGSILTLEAKAVSPGSPGSKIVYRWEKQDQGILFGSTEKYVINPFNAAAAGTYICFASNSCDDVASQPMKISIQPEVKIMSNPRDTVLCEDRPVTLSCRVNLPAEVDSVRWYRLSSGGDKRMVDDPVYVSGSTTYNLTINKMRLTDVASYRCVVYYTCGSVSSARAAVNINEKPRIVRKIVDGGVKSKVCQGTEQILSIEATGKELLQYSWYIDDEVIPGANSSSVKIRFDSTVTCVCMVQNYCNAARDTFTVKVVPAVTFPLAGEGDNHYCADKPGIRLSLPATDTNYVYTLYGDGNVLASYSGWVVNPKGGPLTFGYYKKGEYVVWGKDVKNECDFQMAGKIQIVEDTLTPAFDVKIKTPVCSHGALGEIVLSGSIKRRDNSVEYTLYKSDGAGKWIPAGLTLPGNGGELVWSNVSLGTYKVKAVDHKAGTDMGGCEVWMNGEVSLLEREVPASCKFYAVGADTVYCDQNPSRVTLGMKEDCVQEGMTYTLVKDGVILTDSVAKTRPVSWTGLIEGVYSAEIKNLWGCTVKTNTVTVVKKPVPAKTIFSISGNNCFCSGEEGTKMLLLTKGEKNVKYEFYKKPEIQVYTEYGDNKAIKVTVPYADATYYAVAIDTASGCSIKMTGEPAVVESLMEVTGEPAHIDLNAGEWYTQLELKVTKAVNTPVTVTWDSEDYFEFENNDRLRPILYWYGDQPTVYTATVTDGCCTVQQPINVIVAGDVLKAEITDKNFNSIPKDTVWVCQNASYALDASVSGGTGYGYEYIWTQNGKTLSSSIYSKLNAEALESGFVYLTVRNVLLEVKDSIWLEVHPDPAKELVLKNQGDVCVGLGDNIQLRLGNAQPGVNYSLEYSLSGEDKTYTSLGISKTATAVEDIVLERLFDNVSKVGYYRVKVTKEYGINPKQICPSSFQGKIHVKEGTPLTQIDGGGEYCQRAEDDTIRVYHSVKGSVYRLLHKRETGRTYETVTGVDKQEGTDNELTFVGKREDGYYKVVAERTETGCVDTMNGVVHIKHYPLPAIGKLITEDTMYCQSPQLNVQIGITDCISTNTYTLYRATKAGERIQMAQATGKSGDIVFGSNYNDLGLYFVVANDGHCENIQGNVRIAQSPVEPKLEVGDTGYCVNESALELKVKLYDADYAIVYDLCQKNTGNVMGSFGSWYEDTVYYKGNVEVGDYVVKARVAPTCVVNIPDVIHVVKYPLPAKRNILKPFEACVGTSLIAGVENSESSVVYSLYQKEEEGKDKFIEMLPGDGNKLTFVTPIISKGKYYVTATSDNTGCVEQLGDYTMSPQPDMYNVIAVDKEYCEYRETDGAQIGLAGSQTDVEYFLQQYDDQKGAFKDVEGIPSFMGVGTGDDIFFTGKLQAGRYRVRTDRCDSACMNGEIIVRAKKLPVDTMLIEIAGNACVDSTFQLVIKPTENGTNYTLWKGETEVATAITGNDSDQSWTLSNLGAGTYTIQAEKEGCVRDLAREINVNTLYPVTNLKGIDKMCEFAKTELKLSTFTEGIEYYVANGQTGKKVVDGKARGAEMIFSNVPVGSFYAVSKNGDCKAYSSLYTIKTIQAPHIQNVTFNYTDCALAAGSGEIAVSNMTDTLIYSLILPDKSVQKLTVDADNNGATKKFTGLSFGEYTFKVQGVKSGCYSQDTLVTLRQGIPAGDTLMLPLGYCDGALGAKLELANASTNIRYVIYDKDGKGVDSLYNQGKLFKQTFTVGDYTLKRVRERYLGGCTETTPFKVKKYIYPSTDKQITVTGDPLMCAGENYVITVKNAEADVAYILQRDGVSVDTIWGAGDVDFASVKQNGYYKILPKGGNLCGTSRLDTVVVIKALPQLVNAMDCQFCTNLDGTGEEGCNIEIYGATRNVKYLLSDRSNFIDTIKADITVPYISFEKKTAGKYDIWALDTVTGCRVLADSAEITEGLQPARFLVGGDGARCGTEIEVATVDGSESDTVEYYMYRDGVQVAGPKKTTGSANVTFGLQRTYGVYKIYAQKLTNGCGTFMNDSIVIAPGLKRDTLDRRGSYCENTAGSDIRFVMHNPQTGWKYTVSQEKEGALVAAGDTLKGVGSSGIIWNKIGKNPIRAGEYILYAVDGCGDGFAMDTIVVDTNKVPKIQKFIWRGGQLCRGNKQELKLEGSEVIAEYELFLDDSERTVSLAKQKGTGAALSFGEFDRAGVYFVISRNIQTSCQDTMDKIKMTVIQGIDDPGVVSLTGGSVCLSNPLAELTVMLKEKALNDPVDYYLRRTHGVDTVMVDTIEYSVEHLNKTKFDAQNVVGQYDVVAKKGTCVSVFPGYKVGAPPTVFDVRPLTTAVCVGRKVTITLSGSEKGTDYELFYIQHNGLDTDTLSTGLTTKGTGGAVSLYDSVRVSGVYVARADNGCSANMKDSAQVTIKYPYKITLEKEYVKCQGDSVQIEVKGIVNPTVGSVYRLLQPGENLSAMGKQHRVQAADETSFTFDGWYKKPGYYRVVGMDRGTGCQEMDSVLLRFVNLPNKYAISTEPNEYICSQQGHSIVMSGAQEGITYTLFKKQGTDIISKGSKNWDGLNSVVFSVNEPGSYVVQAQATGSELGCTEWMDGEIALISSDEIRQIQLVSILDKYCGAPGATPAGKVKLASSDPGVEYQLCLDGKPYENVWHPGTSTHDPIVWDNLPGGMPKMTAEQTKVGNVYTVRARSITSGCEQNMLGSVTVIAERSIIFEDNHFDKELPKCIGGTLQLLVPAYGGQITYTWQKDGMDITTGPNNYYLKENIQSADNGLYRCIMSNTCGKDTTRTVSVVPGLLIDKEGDLADQTVCDLGLTEERNVRLQSAIKNAVKYSWIKDGKVLDDKKDLWLDVVVSREKGIGMYVCTASNECGTLKDTCYVRVDSTPRIQAKPLVVDTLCAGSPYSLHIASNFQTTWYRGTNNTGQTGTTLNIVSVKPEDEGLYKVVAKNGCGESTAEVGRLWVDTLLHDESAEPSPVNMTLCENSPLNLIFHTTQTNRVSYIWKDEFGKTLGNKNQLDNVNIKDYANDKVTFTVTARNKCGALMKDYKVQIIRSLKFEEPVEMIKLCVNSSAVDTVLRVKVLNDPDNKVNYNWMFYSVKKEEVVDLNVHTPELKIPLLTDNFGYYYCGMANSCADTTTRTSFVRIDTVPEYAINLPTDTTVCGNNPLTLKVGAKGGAVTYEWYIQKHTEAVPKLVSTENKNTKTSESTLTFTPDTSYREAIVTCKIKNSCSTIASKTMTLHVWDPIEFKVTSSGAVLCASAETKIYISGKNAALPWQYKYKHGDKEIASAKLVKENDTLAVKDGGIYEFIYLKDNRGCSYAGSLAAVNLQKMDVSDVSLTLVGDRATVCSGSDVQLKLEMTGTVPGPWLVEVRRQSDGLLATEMGFTEAVKVTKRDTTFTFKLSNMETYFARVQNVYTTPDATCEAHNITEPIKLSIVEAPKITVNGPLTVEQRTFSKCANIDLQTLFNVQIVGGSGKTGAYMANGVLCAGNWWLDSQTPGGNGQYVIKYQIWDMGCATEQELGTLFIKDKPKATIWGNYSHLCPGTGAEVKITGQGEYPLKVSYVVTSVDWEGKKSSFNVVDAKIQNKDTLTIPVNHQTTLKEVIYTVTRVEDKLKCIADDIEELKDTVCFEKYPEFEVKARSPKEGWSEIEWQYLIMPTDSVEVNVKMVSGSKPWFIGYERFPNLDPVMLSGLTENEKQVSLKKQGLYSFTIGDKYCIAELYPNYQVKVLDTVRLSLMALLEGPYTGGKMVSSTATRNLLKDSRPEAWPTLSKAIIDWVDVELWTVPAKTGEVSTLFTSQACLLLEDGTIVDSKGKNKIALLADTCKYYVAIRHRNHLAVMSKAKKLDNSTSIDFRMGDIYIKEGQQLDHMTLNANGQWMLSAGEFDKLRLISAYEPNKTAKDALSMTKNVQPVTKALLDLDVNFDGNVDWPGFGVDAAGSIADWAIVWKNRNGTQGKGKYSEVPNR